MEKLMIRFLVDMVWVTKRGTFGALRRERLRVKEGQVMCFDKCNDKLNFGKCWTLGELIVSPISSFKDIYNAVEDGIIEIFKTDKKYYRGIKEIKGTAEGVLRCKKDKECSKLKGCNYCHNKAKIELVLIEGFWGSPEELLKKAEELTKTYQTNIDIIKQGFLPQGVLVKAIAEEYGLDFKIINDAVKIGKKASLD